MQKFTIEQVVEHHLKQNINQKITPHLIVGLVQLIVLDCRKNELLGELTNSSIRENAND